MYKLYSVSDNLMNIFIIDFDDILEAWKAATRISIDLNKTMRVFNSETKELIIESRYDNL